MAITYTLPPWCPQQFFDANGDPLASGTAYFYQPGTTTPQQTYSDTSGALNASPGVPLNSSGRPTSGAIYLDASLSYKLLVKDSLGVTVPGGTYDPLYLASTGINATVGITNASSPYTVLTSSGNDVLILANASSGAITVNLYAVSGNDGRRVTVMKTDSTANAVTIDGNGAETINGALTYVLTGQYQAAQLATNGTTWFIKGQTSKVIQVVSATYAVETSSSSGSYADTGLTATITPTSAASKILVIVNQNGIEKDTGNTACTVSLLRGASLIATGFSGKAGGTGSAATNQVGSASIAIVDSPASTSAVVYKTQFLSDSAIAAVKVQFTSAPSSIVLMELAA